ncbi:pyridoxine/pyridoxamine 5'-phosphate oxidase [Protaetiibacter mangrovi]|uniref:Pyridoxal 5'-phosphate synthase n=1 Tax=Protaetiibacter mangrovi TaxID=2970926 RepID=A0ABT1ZHJ5_9MICO|nr:pyridoxal 5'-phosphate synthase [Protaetiibacter mangrovi]MCS0500192.1 pyridoxal 5'-phosphate synthase [Protaetiibacter mangrovi]TPX05099.1 pyridoxal 5'-phosphate synthase [Schumannella luteola]
MGDPSRAGLRARLRSLPSFPAELPAFDPADAPGEPEELFLGWLDDAVGAGVLAAHAAVLATVDDAGPSARVLILKDVGPEGWAIATPSDSRPGAAMTASGRAALTFFWPARARQVRVEGAVERADAAEAALDFLARPDDARATALVGRPTPVLRGDADYTAVREAALARVTDDPALVPGSWALWRIVPQAVEFWQGAHDRAHLRLRYRRHGDSWLRERLWP